MLIKSPFSSCDCACRRGAIWSLLHKPFWRGTGEEGREGGEKRKEGREKPPCCEQDWGRFQQGLETTRCQQPPTLPLSPVLWKCRYSEIFVQPEGVPFFFFLWWLCQLHHYPFSSSSQIRRRFCRVSKPCSQQLWLWVVVVVTWEPSPGLRC